MIHTRNKFQRLNEQKPDSFNEKTKFEFRVICKVDCQSWIPCTSTSTINFPPCV